MRKPLNRRQQHSDAPAQQFGQNHRDSRPNKRRQQRQKTKRHDHAGQNHRWNVAQRPSQTHPVKIARQQRQHPSLNHQRQQHNFPQPQTGLDRQRQQGIHSRPEPLGQSRANPLACRPHFNPELRDFRRVTGISRHVSQMFESVPIRRVAALHPGNRQRRNNSGGQKRKLKTRIEK